MGVEVDVLTALMLICGIIRDISSVVLSLERSREGLR